MKIFLRQAVLAGKHHDPGPDGVLIQLGDPACFFPEPKFPFKHRHQFEFLDADEYTQNVPDEAKITMSQAEEIYKILQDALDNKRNVVVHCSAGICRSGAVADVGEMMGFDYAGSYKQPNLLVKHSLMRVIQAYSFTRRKI